MKKTHETNEALATSIELDAQLDIIFSKICAACLKMQACCTCKIYQNKVQRDQLIFDLEKMCEKKNDK